jgi:hypothetical protein
MRRQLKQVRRSARSTARVEQGPHTPITLTSQTTNEVPALLARIDRLIGLREAS